ncbi:MAG: C25 family cysteine peptidase [Candidatus Eisenbacteria bacterium]
MTPRHLAYWLLGAMVCAAPPAWATGPATDTSFGSETVSVVPQGEFSKVTVQGCGSLTDVGKPELPVSVLRFVVPSDMRVEDVTISYLVEEELPGVHRILPAQPQVPIGETPAWAGPDRAIYESDELYPPNRVEYLGDGYLGGYRIASVAIYPLRYAPRSGRLVLASDVSVKLELVPAANRAHPRGRMTVNSEELYRGLIETVVENPREVEGKLSGVDVVDGIAEEGFLPRYSPSLEGSPVEYVIITSDNFVSYFQPLADWKTKKGVPTVIRTVSWIEANYPGGTDKTERIRFFIQDAYESWGATYFLLGGDTSIVPVRFGWSAYYGGWDVSSDLYYSDLDDNWNQDGDSRFGEGYSGVSSPGDSVDLYPDVFVGRAPAASALEVETFVTKTLTYEKTPAGTFAAQNVYLAEVLFPYDWEPPGLITTDGAEHIVQPVLPLVPADVHAALVYQNYEPFSESFPLSAQAAMDSMNVGYNITSHVGHGSKDILRCSKNNYISVQDVDALTNGVDRSGFLWMLNCTTTAIEYDCIAEHFMNNPNGGSAFVFGPTRYCFPTTAKDYYYTWHELLYSGVDRAGVVCAMCKIPYVSESSYDNTDRWTQMSYVLLGDPESRLWTKRPVALSAIHDSSMPLGPTDLTVTVVDPAAVDSAFVCVVKSGQVYATGYTNASGQAVLSFTPKTTGTMTITVTARNHYPYEDTIGVTSSIGAHLTLRATTVDDDAVGGSDGNANGYAEAGETVELNVTVGNGGLTAATSVTATLSTTDLYVSLVDDTESLGTVAASTQVAYPAAFSVAIADSCPNDHEVEFTLQFAEPARGSWSDTYTLKVLRPILTQLHNDYDDGNDGVPGVGETVTLTIDILNEGNGEADIVSGELNYPSAEVSITDSADTWGDIVAGATASGQAGFVFTVNSAMTQEFELVLTDEDGKTWTHNFDAVEPTMPVGLDGRVKATTVYLTWNPVADLDLWGYHVYRTDHPFGTFEQVSSAVVERISYYEDAGLVENQRYYYYVSAVDSSGNEGVHSGTLEVTTNPPAQAGWPLLGGEAMYGSPAAADVDLDGDLEVLVGSGEVYCWHHDGTELIDGDGDPRTEGILAADGTGGYRSSIALGQLDNDPYLEIVGAAWGDVGAVGSPNYEIWAWNAEDGTPLGGDWPATMNRFCWATPTLADLDHDGLDEVIVPCANGFLYVLKPDGSGFLNPDGTFATLRAAWAYGSAAVADLDQDLDLEIIVPSRSDSVYAFNPDGSAVPGWPVNLGGDVRTSVAVGDVNNNGLIEVVAGTNTDQIYLLSGEGQVFPNWPKACVQNDDFASSPTLADLDGDGDLEILMSSSDNKIHVWTWEGAIYPGAWPRTIVDGGVADKRGSVSVGDIDDDADLEIIVGSNNGQVCAYDTDGTLIDGWPIQTDAEIHSSPTLEDLDRDGDMEVVVSGMDGMVYVWDTEGSYSDGDGIEWGNFRHDNRRSGFYGYELEVGVPGDESWSVTGAKLDQNVPNPFNPVTTIAYAVPDGGADIDLAVFNIAGMRVATLVSGRVPEGRRSVTWDGTDARGVSVASGIYFVRLTAEGALLTRKVTLLK